MTVKVSVIVPIYNVEKYLEKCLKSIINQTLKDIEINCINDGSKDKSGEILEKFKHLDSRLITIHKNNEGLSIARNVGIEIAKGEYLSFVDSDDWLDFDYLEKLYFAAKKHNCDIACAGFKRCKNWRKSIRKSFKQETILTEINEKIKADNLPEDNYVWNKIYKRKIWLQNNLEFAPHRYFEDIALTVKILYSMGNMVTVPNTYYNYRKNPVSVTATITKKHKDDYNWAKANMLNFVKENNIKMPRRKSFYKKEYIKMFNFTIIKIYHYEDVVKYQLLGFIPFIKKISC